MHPRFVGRPMTNRRTALRRLLAAAVALLVVASGGVATAQTGSDGDGNGDGAGNPAWAGVLFEGLQGMAATYNEDVGEAQEEMSPATRQVFNRLKGKTVNAYFAGTDVTFSFRMTQSGHITDLRPRPRDDAALAMHLTRDTAESLVAADQPVDAFVSAVRNGRFVGDVEDRTAQGVVITGEQGHVVEQATWTVVNAAKGFL